MKAAKAAALALLAGLLGGCLEVEQHPGWVRGTYAGQHDSRSADARFSKDKLAWSAAVADRSARQNEYNRTKP